MYINSNAYKSYICFLALLIIIGFIILHFLNSYFLVSLLFGFWLIVSIIEFSDYKLVLTDKKIEFYSIFKQRKEVNLRDINKIKIKKDNVSSLLGSIENIHVYMDNEEYVFKSNRLNNKSIYEDIEALSKIINIAYEEQ